MTVPAISFEIRTDLVTPRTHKQIMRRLNRQAMTRIRFTYLPRHFERNAQTNPGGEYGFEPRTAKYQRKKAAVKRHQKPLVYSGRMRTHILANARITATANGGRLRTRNYFPMTAQRRSEIEVVGRSEQKEIADRAGRDYIRLAQLPEYRRRQRKRNASGQFTN